MTDTVLFAASGPVLLGILILLSVFLKWPTWIHYIWGTVAILWGLISFL